MTFENYQVLVFPAPIPSCNIAFKKPTYQSGTGYGGVSSRAVDGNRDPRWSQYSCTHTGTANDPFWVVDLGRNFRISHVTITNRAECTYMPWYAKLCSYLSYYWWIYSCVMTKEPRSKLLFAYWVAINRINRLSSTFKNNDTWEYHL